MTTIAAIKRLDGFKKIRSSVPMQAIPRAMLSLALQTVKEEFSRRITLAISPTAHRAAHAIDCEIALEPMTRTLTAMVEVVKFVRCEHAAKLFRYHGHFFFPFFGSPSYTTRWKAKSQGSFTAKP
jgi:hypothetical protein